MNALTIMAPSEAPTTETDGGGSERERLLVMWRLYPDALVDLVATEIEGGSADGAGRLEMSDVDGNFIEEFHFSDAAAADEAVIYALRQLNPGAD